MEGIIESGATVVVAPPKELLVGDVVLVKVRRSTYLHLIKEIKNGEYLIGNNKGDLNGWVLLESIYGVAVSVNGNTIKTLTDKPRLILAVNVVIEGSLDGRSSMYRWTCGNCAFKGNSRVDDFLSKVNVAHRDCDRCGLSNGIDMQKAWDERTKKMEAK